MRSDRNGLVNLVHVWANMCFYSIFLFNFQFARTNT